MAADKSSDKRVLDLTTDLNSGVFRDTFATVTPLWVDGSNVRFSSTGVAKALGFASIFTEQDTKAIRGMTQLIDSGVQKLYFGDRTTIYESVAAGTPTAKGTGYTGSENDTATVIAGTWSMTPFGSFVAATNGVDTPQLKKAGNFEDIFGFLISITVDTAGTGYSVSDPVTITGGGGTGATAQVATIGGSGEILTVSVTASGSGYTSVPSASAGAGGAVLTAVISVQSFNTAEIFTKRFGHIMAFGLDATLGATAFAWASSDDPEDWDFDSTTNTAGTLLIREAEGSAIRAAVPLGDRHAVYTEDKMFLVTFIGGSNIFGYQAALEGIGAVGKQAVVTVNRFNYGVSRSGIWRTDGVSKAYIDDSSIHDYLQQNVNWAQKSKINCYHNEELNQVVFFFPIGAATEPSEGWAFDYINETWAPVGYGRTSGLPRDTFTSPILATDSGDVFFHNFGNDADGSAFVASVQTKGYDFNDPDRFKELQGIRIGFTGSGLRYRIGTSLDPSGSITFGSFRESPPSFQLAPLRIAGQYFFLEFQSQDVGDAWEIEHVILYATSEGGR